MSCQCINIMHSPFWTISTAAVCVAVAQASSLEDVCTSAYAVAALPAANFYQGITIDNASVTANPVYAANASGNVMFPDSTFDYCNISFSYSHDGIEGDKVRLVYWLPSPDNFKDRFLSTGGGGYLISSGDGLSGSLPGGIIYGAAAGTTDAGFGSLSTQFSSVFLLANGTANFHNLNMFGFQAIHEMTVLGKEFTKGFFNMTKDDKLYAYYQGCSEGGRDGWSQIQRYGGQFDGAVVGAPAFRFAFQQVQHAYSDIVEQTLDYYPPPCEMEKILNETITACDPLDGKTDGVVARTDLCKLHFNTSSLIGTPYSCAASPVYMGFPPHPAWPAQNGTVTAKAVQVAVTIIQGLRDSHGKQAYLSYQPASIFADAFTQYDTNTSSFTLWPSDFAAQFVLPFLDLVNATSFANLNNVTYDTLKQWMYEGWQMYESTLHTTWPDLSSYHSSGGKILHYHGESDFSIPTGSSVHYRDSVREIMYPHLSFNASNAALNEWYRLFLIPGAGHCGLNAYQPNHPFPQTNLQVMIEWVEKGIVPQTLNATVLQGDRKGENEQVCAWPLRPSWSKSGNVSVECRFDSKSLETWEVEFDAFKMPVY
ncbi:feruloyl esteras-like protein B precursor [Aureobasidium pullulans]|nr:feruloyl esteras-like protein B precursor [Aureobasidium pullulans]